MSLYPNTYRKWLLIRPRLWTDVQPILFFLLSSSFVALLATETHQPCNLAVLFVQMFLLLVATALGAAMGIQALQLSDPGTKGVILGCGAFLWSVVFLGSLRIVVLWRIDTEDRRNGRWTTKGYGTTDETQSANEY